MTLPGKKDYDKLFLIAHALNDAVEAQIDECLADKGSGTPGWEREDYEANQYELRRMQDAKVFSQALVLFADKHGKLNPLEEERVMQGLSTEPGIFSEPPKLSFFLLKPGDMDKIMQRYMGSRAGDVADVQDALKSAFAPIKAMPPTIALEHLLAETPPLSDELHEIAAPAIELRKSIKAITQTGYARGEHIGSDLMTVCMHFSSASHGHFKRQPPAEFARIGKAFRQWEAALRRGGLSAGPLTRDNVGMLARSAAIVGDVKDTLAAHSSGEDAWPPMSDDAGKALLRLNYLAGEMTELVEGRFTKLVPKKRDIAPDQADRPDGTSRGKAEG